MNKIQPHSNQKHLAVALTIVTVFLFVAGIAFERILLQGDTSGRIQASSFSAACEECRKSADDAGTAAWNKCVDDRKTDPQYGYPGCENDADPQKCDKAYAEIEKSCQADDLDAKAYEEEWKRCQSSQSPPLECDKEPTLTPTPGSGGGGTGDEQQCRALADPEADKAWTWCMTEGHADLKCTDDKVADFAWKEKFDTCKQACSEETCLTECRKEADTEANAKYAECAIRIRTELAGNEQARTDVCKSHKVAENRWNDVFWKCMNGIEVPTTTPAQYQPPDNGGGGGGGTGGGSSGGESPQQGINTFCSTQKFQISGFFENANKCYFCYWTTDKGTQVKRGSLNDMSLCKNQKSCPAPNTCTDLSICKGSGRTWVKGKSCAAATDVCCEKVILSAQDKRDLEQCIQEAQKKATDRLKDDAERACLAKYNTDNPCGPLGCGTIDPTQDGTGGTGGTTSEKKASGIVKVKGISGKTIYVYRSTYRKGGGQMKVATITPDATATEKTSERSYTWQADCVGDFYYFAQMEMNSGPPLVSAYTTASGGEQRHFAKCGETISEPIIITNPNAPQSQGPSCTNKYGSTGSCIADRNSCAITLGYVLSAEGTDGCSAGNFCCAKAL